jgi:hypothetical protein
MRLRLGGQVYFSEMMAIAILFSTDRFMESAKIISIIKKSTVRIDGCLRFGLLCGRLHFFTEFFIRGGRRPNVGSELESRAAGLRHIDRYRADCDPILRTIECG